MDTSSQVVIRPARIRDLEVLVSLLEVLFCIEEDFIPNASRQLKALQLLLNDERSIVLVAEQGIRIIGMCSGQRVISTAEGGPAILVEDVVVDPDYRGIGIGGKLLESIFRWAEENSASRLQLLADRKNRAALNFYEKTGWQETRLICLRKRKKRSGRRKI